MRVEKKTQGQALRLLLVDEACRREFLNFDVRQYKAHSVKSIKSLEFAYKCESLDAECNEDDGYSRYEGCLDEVIDDEDDGTPFICESPTVSGEICGQGFSTRQALLLHQRRSKKTRPQLGHTNCRPPY